MWGQILSIHRLKVHWAGFWVSFTLECPHTQLCLPTFIFHSSWPYRLVWTKSLSCKSHVGHKSAEWRSCQNKDILIICWSSKWSCSGIKEVKRELDSLHGQGRPCESFIVREVINFVLRIIAPLLITDVIPLGSKRIPCSLQKSSDINSVTSSWKDICRYRLFPWQKILVTENLILRKIHLPGKTWFLGTRLSIVPGCECLSGLVQGPCQSADEATIVSVDWLKALVNQLVCLSLSSDQEPRKNGDSKRLTNMIAGIEALIGWTFVLNQASPQTELHKGVQMPWLYFMGFSLEHSTISIITFTWWPTRFSTSARLWPPCSTMLCLLPSENSTWKLWENCVADTAPGSHCLWGFQIVSSSGQPPETPSWRK